MTDPLMLIDGYKLDHRRQYPPGTTRVYSNWTPRSSRVYDTKAVVLFGLQYFLREYLERRTRRDFFDRPLMEVTSRYWNRTGAYLGPNQVGTEHIAALHELGRVPLRVCALPEGTRIPVGVPMLTVENTHPDFFWLPNYYETLLSNILWLPCTSATTADRYRRLLDLRCARTGGDPSFVPWQGHDFSFRGLPGLEAAQLSGAAHLLSFTGTDTIPALELIDRDYPHDGTELIGGSVAATEHSVMSAGGEAGEEATFARLLALYPTGIVSVVSDTWNLWKVLTETLPRLKDRIMARNGRLVIRPDSGDPVDILCGDRRFEVYANPKRRPEMLGVVQLLWEIFGGTLTQTGHKVLDPHIGVIYGDSITYERCREICDRLEARGFASTNVVFGIGSYTYQYVTRDTYGFAMKATWAEISGRGHDLFKKPVTDDGGKFSARGRLAVTEDLKLIQQATPEEETRSLLRPVWEDGALLVKDSFLTIRERLRASAGAAERAEEAPRIG